MTRTNDLISIILPVYNVKDYVEECIKSILNQTYKNIEVIIVDDGSTDGSELICDKYKELDNRIIVIHQPNMGLSSARNTGLHTCRGKYISFIDSDDYIESNYVEELYKLIKKNNVRISICKIKVLKDGKFYSRSDDILNKKGEIIKGKDCIFSSYVWNKMYDVSVWNSIEFDIGKWYEDVFIMYKIMYPEENVAITNKELYVYRKRVGSISNSVFDVDKIRDLLEARKQRIDFFKYKEKYLYDLSVEKYLGAIRQYYCALYLSDNKKEMQTIIKEYRKMYSSILLKSKLGLNENIKSFAFYIMPSFFAKLKCKMVK